MTQSSFSRFTSQVVSNNNNGFIAGGIHNTNVYPVIVRGAGEHVFFLASDCMASFVDPTTPKSSTLTNPSTCAAQVIMHIELSGLLVI
jgi:hypothetical protein